MTTLQSIRPLNELVEEVAERLSSEQILAIGARVSAAELVRSQAPAPHQFDLAAEVAFDLAAAVRHLVSLWGPAGIGCDTDLVAAWLRPLLVNAGVPETDALAALERETGWRPRTPAQREVAVAEAMLADGFERGLVVSALAATRKAVAA